MISHDLKELNERLNKSGFSWQHSDYFLLKEMLPNIIEALEILERFNPLRNDLDAYLLDVIEWAQGKGAKPNPKDFGLQEKKQK